MISIYLCLGYMYGFVKGDVTLVENSNVALLLYLSL